MAEAVHAILEEMVPELDDLKKRSIFSPEEIKIIAKRRIDFEYSLHRRVTEKADYLQCIQYEMNLNTLREKRKQRLGIHRKNLPSDYHMTKRIHFVFMRMLKKFRGDRRLWLQYFAFCRKFNSDTLLSKAFAQALSFHPRVSAFWIEAAKYEYEKRNNIKAARGMVGIHIYASNGNTDLVLLQRGIRINMHSKELYLEYFRLELLYVEKVRLRKEVLGINDSNMPIAVHYKVPAIVYQSAIAAIPDDVQFRLEFAEIYALFPNTEAIVENDIYAAFESDSRINCQEIAHSLLAKRSFDYDRMCTTYDHAIAKFSNVLMTDYYLASLVEIPATTDTLEATIAKKIITVATEAVDDGRLSQKSFDATAAWLMRRGYRSDAITISDVFRSQASGDSSRWLSSLRLYIECLPSDETLMDAIDTLFNKAIDLHYSCLELWLLYIDFCTTYNAGHLKCIYKRCIPMTCGHFETQLKLQQSHVQWALKNEGIEACRVLYQQYLNNAPPSLLGDLIVECLAIEQQFDSATHIECLYDRLIDLSPKTMGTESTATLFVDNTLSEAYNCYMSYLRNANNYRKLASVYRKAQKTIKGDCEAKLTAF